MAHRVSGSPAIDAEATGVYQRRASSAGETPQLTPREMSEIVSLVRRVAMQTDLASALRVLQRGVAELTLSARAHCLTHDPATGEPWAAHRRGTGARTDCLAAIVADRGQPVHVRCAGDRVPFEPNVDDPGGEGDAQLLAVPIATGGAVVAVLIAARGPSAPVFTTRDHLAMASIANQCGAILWHSIQAQALKSAGNAQGEHALFRGQALEQHRSQQREGNPVGLSPSWVSRAYWAVLGVLAIAFLFSFLARVDQYSTGPAVIRIEGTEVTARAPGTVQAATVIPGQLVDEGALLVKLHDDTEAAELEEIQMEYERKLGTFLFDPADRDARSSLSTTAARKQKAERLLETRAVRAPRSGIVSDVRVRPGSRLSPGDHILTIVSEDALPTIVALLPGADRPRLRPGMTLQLELPGYEKARERAVVVDVGQEVIGPQEARRYLGEKIADALKIKGPVVIVRANLQSRTFEARDKTYGYHDGMTARAEVSVRKRRVIVALLPALERLL